MNEMEYEIGTRLRDARRAGGVELDAVERQIKVRKRYLVAMEEERWEDLPGEAYVRGFLRTYADCLGLDGDELVAEYEVQAGEGGPAPEAPAAPPPRAGAPGGPEAPGEDATTPSAAAEAVRPLSVRTRVGAARRAAALTPRGRLLAALAALAAAAAIAALALAGGSEDREPAGRDGAPQAGEEEPAGEQDADDPEEAASPQRVSLELAATGDVWVCLVDHRDRPLVEGVTLLAGEEQGPFRARAFALTVGNGQVELIADGEPVPTSDAPDPAGYRVTARGSRELPPEQRPTCE